MDATKTPKEIFSPDIQKDLLVLEEQEGSVNFKFGVVYMKAGQKCDDEMLSNGRFQLISTQSKLQAIAKHTIQIFSHVISFNWFWKMYSWAISLYECWL